MSVNSLAGRRASPERLGPVAQRRGSSVAEQAAHNRCVAGPIPAPATSGPPQGAHHDTDGSEDHEMAKGDNRPTITLACTECKRRNYVTVKNRVNDRDRIELRKYCRWERRHTLHRETR